MASKDQLRALSVGAKKKFRCELVELVVDEGVLRRPRAKVQAVRELAAVDGAETTKSVPMVNDDGSPVMIDPDAGLERVTYEIRQPSIDARSAILTGAGAFNKSKPTDTLKLQIHALVACAFVPGTDEKIFDVADFDSLKAQPTGSWADELSSVALGFLNVQQSEAAGKSAATPN